MKSLDWQTSIPRAADVGRVQQVTALQGEVAQEHLERVARAGERKTPRVKDSARASPVRDRGGRQQQGHADERSRRSPSGEAPVPGHQSHLDIRV